MVAEIADDVDLGLGDLVVRLGGHDHGVDQSFLRTEHRDLLLGRAGVRGYTRPSLDAW